MSANAALYKTVIQALLLLIWTASAFAAAPILTTAPTIEDIPLRAVAVAIFLALIGGAARSAQKLADPDKQITSVPMALLADLLTSVAVGTATYFLVAWREFPPLLQAFVITVAGFSGTKFLEQYTDALIKRLTGTYAGRERRQPGDRNDNA